jgi:hypothetical protein
VKALGVGDNSVKIENDASFAHGGGFYPKAGVFRRARCGGRKNLLISLTFCAFLVHFV